MSGICGVLAVGSQKVEPELIRDMLDASAYLGPEDQKFWCVENIGFGYQHLSSSNWQNAEQPIVNKSENFVLVADIRIDNRKELIKTLRSTGLLKEPAPSDPTILIAALQHWGKECGRYILGDYAFAILNTKSKEITCVRDALGRKQLFYYFDGKNFAFATTIKQLLSCRFVRKSINRIAIAHYLTGKPIDYSIENTFYKNIYRLEAAHFLEVSLRNGIRKVRYWDIDRDKQLSCATDQDYADEFLFLLRQCTNDYSQSTGKLGVLTSGGMDSTSIVALLSEQDHSDPELFNIGYGKGHSEDESHYVVELAKRCNLKFNIIDGMQYLPFLTEVSGVRTYDEPPPYFDHAQWDATFQLAHNSGVSTLLGGFSGDGLYMVQPYVSIDYIKQGRIFHALKEFQTYSHLLSINNQRQQLLSLLKVIVSTVTPISIKMLKNNLTSDSSILHPELEKELRSIQKWNMPFCWDYGFNTYHQNRRYYLLTQQILPYLNFSYDLAAKNGLEMRDPFGDRRMVEFSLAMPPEQCFREGKSKYILRRAMKNILPDSIRLRSTKTDFRSILNLGLSKFLTQKQPVKVKDMYCVKGEILLAQRIENQLELAIAGLQSMDNSYEFNSRPLSRVLLLEHWLNHIKIN